MKAIRVYIGKSTTKCIYGRVYTIDITSSATASLAFMVTGKNFAINYSNFNEYYKDWQVPLLDKQIKL